MENVLWIVYRVGIIFLWGRKPAAEIAFLHGNRAIPTIELFYYARVSGFDHPSAGLSGFLVAACAVHERSRSNGRETACCRGHGEDSDDMTERKLPMKNTVRLAITSQLSSGALSLWTLEAPG